VRQSEAGLARERRDSLSPWMINVPDDQPFAELVDVA
jgi:hypothetical protein